MTGLTVAQGALIGRGQPGIAEAPAQPAIGAFQQTFLGHLLNGGEQRQIELMRRHVAGNQLEHGVATIRATLAHQQPVIAPVQTQGQAYRHAQIGQLDGKARAVRHLKRAAPLEHLLKIQRLPQALVTQPIRAGLDEQWQGLERAWVLADQRTWHLGSSFRRGVRRLASRHSRAGQVATKTAQGCPKRATPYNPGPVRGRDRPNRCPAK